MEPFVVTPDPHCWMLANSNNPATSVRRLIVGARDEWAQVGDFPGSIEPAPDWCGPTVHVYDWFAEGNPSWERPT